MPSKKPAPEPGAKKRRERPVGNLVHAMQRDAQQMRLAAVLERQDEIFELYMCGHSFEVAVQMLGMTESPNYVRLKLWEHAHDQYLMATKARAHNLVEKAVDVASLSTRLGDAAGMRVAVDTYLKVASKISPEDYGDKTKIEHTGKDGGPIETKADLTLSPADAYEKMVRGAR
jgi:hypothetical protein